MLRIPRVFGIVCILVSSLACGVPVLAVWTGAPSPHDEAHLVVIKAADLRDAKNQPVPTAKVDVAAFGTAVELRQPARARVVIRHAGDYTLWVRVSIPSKLKLPVTVRLRQGDEDLITGTAGEGQGEESAGGPAGFEAYAAVARKTGAEGRAENAVEALDLDSEKNRKKEATGLSEFEEELNAEKKTQKTRTPEAWIQSSRLEEPSGDRPYYWWKIEAASLEPGEYELHLTPTPAKRAETFAAVDAAFLSTSTEITYPYVGDIEAIRSSYVRFRIDALPEKGVAIGAAIKIHGEPWNTSQVWLNPARINITRSEAHTSTGFTRWYRLQDIEYAPPFGESEGHLHLNFQPPEARSELLGATQFAVMPHQDDLLREIPWSDAGADDISFLTDFQTYLHRLRTVRDHAREHYDFAVGATGQRLFPLTRGDLYFGNAWGGASGVPVDYMVKTLRLLGFNSVGQASDPLDYRKLYGWTSHTGEYWPPVHLPFDEAAAVKEYEAYYKQFFSKQREMYEGVSIFQLADEPGEISRPEMSAPRWRFSRAESDKTGKSEKWSDLTGDSALHTRNCELENCVLEGKVSQLGTWIGFRVAVNDAENPTQYADWQLGAVSQNREQNVAATRKGMKPDGTSLATRRGAVIGKEPTEFKIVYERNSAALFIAGKLVHQHTDLPPKGGFGIFGPPKTISALTIREIRKDEHLSTETPEDAVAGNSKAKSKPALTDLDDDDPLSDPKGKTPAWMKPKPLDTFVKEDWVVGGGLPEAHVAFRRWAQEHELTPELFGEKSWDDVRMLTVPALVETPEDARLFYWSRRFSGYLTPRMFALSADAIHKYAPNPKMQNFVALSGHALYFPSEMPLDMFQLASGSSAMMPGVSDWMSLGGWRWDSHQAVAYSVAMYNGGARRYGEQPASFPMMHCVWPSEFRAYTMLANQVKYISFYNFGPSYAVTEGFWSEAEGCYSAVHKAANYAAQVDDILPTARMRPSRVALLYSIANEYWNAQSSFADKRATFLGLSHEYFQPELVSEEQVEAGALEHYDALYVLEPVVAAATQEKISGWVKGGGLLWTCADSLAKNEFNEPHDFLAKVAGISRTFAKPAPATQSKPGVAAAEEAPVISPVSGAASFRPHSVATAGIPQAIMAKGAKVRAKYEDGKSAWLETAVGQGKVVYLGHRPGLTYTSKAIRSPGFETAWADTARVPLTEPLHAGHVTRELVLSEPVVMASPLSTENGTVVMLFNMRPTPIDGIKFSLKEPERPFRVEIFEDDKLREIPYEFADGEVQLTLPTLTAGQMVVVRRKPAAADDREQELRARTTTQLDSQDWRALSAGAWFAGFHPEWNLGEKVLPLLEHARWEVRRAAAESLGRMQHKAAAGPLFDLLNREAEAEGSEQDAHVLGDALVALAQLGHEETLRLCEVHMAHADPFVRRQALQAARMFAAGMKKGDAAEQALQTLAENALSDDDLRVRGVAIEIAVKVTPARVLEEAQIVFERHIGQDRVAEPVWARAIATSDAAFGAWIKAGLPGGDRMMYAIAAQRADARLGDALVKRVGTLKNEQGVSFVVAALKQRHQPLARAIFAKHKDLPPSVQTYQTQIQETTFGARLGSVMEDWAAYHAKPAKK